MVAVSSRLAFLTAFIWFAGISAAPVEDTPANLPRSSSHHHNSKAQVIQAPASHSRSRGKNTGHHKHNGHKRTFGGPSSAIARMALYAVNGPAHREARQEDPEPERVQAPFAANDKQSRFARRHHDHDHDHNHDHDHDHDHDHHHHHSRQNLEIVTGAQGFYVNKHRILRREDNAGVPGRIALSTPSTSNDKTVAYLSVVPKGANELIVQADQTNGSQFRMAPTSGTAPEGMMPVKLIYAVFNGSSASTMDFCATYAENPGPEGEVMRMCDCAGDLDEEESQVFWYDTDEKTLQPTTTSARASDTNSITDSAESAADAPTSEGSSDGQPVVLVFVPNEAEIKDVPSSSAPVYTSTVTATETYTSTTTVTSSIPTESISVAQADSTSVLSSSVPTSSAATGSASSPQTTSTARALGLEIVSPSPTSSSSTSSETEATGTVSTQSSSSAASVASNIASGVSVNSLMAANTQPYKWTFQHN